MTWHGSYQHTCTFGMASETSLKSSSVSITSSKYSPPPCHKLKYPSRLSIPCLPHTRYKLTIIQENTKFFLEVMHNQKSNKLEWIIIVLLSAEIVVMSMDLLDVSSRMLRFHKSFSSSSRSQCQKEKRFTLLGLFPIAIMCCFFNIAMLIVCLR